MLTDAKKVSIYLKFTESHWGCGWPTLHTPYRGIYSPIDYGCQAYESASVSMKTKLDVIQHKTLRTCLGVEYDNRIRRTAITFSLDFTNIKILLQKLKAYSCHILGDYNNNLYKTSSCFRFIKKSTYCYIVMLLLVMCDPCDPLVTSYSLHLNSSYRFGIQKWFNTMYL